MHQSLKFHYTNQRKEYEFKWLELENYFNKINKTVYSLDDHNNESCDINFRTHLVCYVRIDFGHKSTKIYTTNEKIPSLFADYVTLNYCDHFVLSWILSWFGCSTLQQFMTYCNKYGLILDELTCLGASFNIFKGTIKKVTMDGNENGVSKRIDLGWKKKAYKFLTQSNVHQIKSPGSLPPISNNTPNLRPGEEQQYQQQQQQQQQQEHHFKQSVRLKIKLNTKN